MSPEGGAGCCNWVPVVGWWWSQFSLLPLHLMFDFSLGSFLFGVPGLSSGLDMDTALLDIQMSRAGLKMPREGKASRKPWSTFQDLKGIYKRTGEGLLAEAWNDRTKGNGCKLGEDRMALN